MDDIGYVIKEARKIDNEELLESDVTLEISQDFDIIRFYYDKEENKIDVCNGTNTVMFQFDLIEFDDFCKRISNYRAEVLSEAKR